MSLVRVAIALVIFVQSVVILILLRPSSGGHDSSLSALPSPVTWKPNTRTLRADKPRLQSATGRAAKKLDVDFDPMPNVHMVYMYANGSDPALVSSRRKYGGSEKANSRDRDNGELRYSLRSLDKFAPWFKGKVIILQGEDAPPFWLNLSHPRVRVVNHHTYFKDVSVLPTFNSDAIHANIHLVPEIQESDVMINWCDDFFLGRPVSPEDWVRNGKPVIYQEPNVIRGASQEFEKLKKEGGNKWLAKIYNTRAAILKQFPSQATNPSGRLHFVKHAPFPMSMKLLREMAEVYAPQYELNTKFKFRTYDTLDVPTLHNMYCQVKHECEIDPQVDNDRDAQLLVLEGKDATNYEKLLRNFAKTPPKFFTFNDGFGDTPPKSVEFAFGELLPSMFPNPSQYERTDL